MNTTRLAHRQRQVVQLAADGWQDQEIADQLGISFQTVRTHLRRAGAKLDARSKPHIVAVAWRSGQIT